MENNNGLIVVLVLAAAVIGVVVVFSNKGKGEQISIAKGANWRGRPPVYGAEGGITYPSEGIVPPTVQPKMNGNKKTGWDKYVDYCTGARTVVGEIGVASGDPRAMAVGRITKVSAPIWCKATSKIGQTFEVAGKNTWQATKGVASSTTKAIRPLVSASAAVARPVTNVAKGIYKNTLGRLF